MTTQEQNDFLTVQQVYKNYKIGKVKVEVLRGIDLSVKEGEWIALLGASGCGKSTLLNLLGTLEMPNSGEICCNKMIYSKMGRRDSAKFRSHFVGFIFQAYHLLPELNVLDNVLLGTRFAGGNIKEVHSRALDLLDKVGLSHRINHRPNELSGGEQQRAAIARALINDPKLLLADEPTGNLDRKTGNEILHLFEEFHRNSSVRRTMIMVTHDPDVAQHADRIIHIVDGRIEQ